MHNAHRAGVLGRIIDLRVGRDVILATRLVDRADEAHRRHGWGHVGHGRGIGDGVGVIGEVNEVEEVEERALVVREFLVANVGPVIVRVQGFSIRPHDAGDGQHGLAGIIEPQVAPACPVRREVHGKAAAGPGGTDNRRVGEVVYRQDVALTFVSGVGHHVLIAIRVGQKILEAIAPRQVNQHFVRNEVGLQRFDDGGVFAAKVRGVRVAGLELGEFAGQGGDHVPRPFAGLAGLNVTQDHGQIGILQRRIVHPRAQQLRHQQQVSLVLHNLRLLRINFHTAGRTVTGIFHQHPNGEGNRTLHQFGKGIVALDVARLEVGDFQLRIGLDVDVVRNGQENFGRYFHAADLAGQPGADAVPDPVRTGPARQDLGNNKPADDRLLGRANHPGAVHAVNVLELRRPDEERRRGVIHHPVGGIRRILEGQIHREIRDGVLPIVVRNFERGLKADAFERQLLQNLDLDPGAQPLLLLLPQAGEGLDQDQAEPKPQEAGGSVGLGPAGWPRTLQRVVEHASIHRFASTVKRDGSSGQTPHMSWTKMPSA